MRQHFVSSTSNRHALSWLQIYGTSCRHIGAHEVHVKFNTLGTLKDVRVAWKAIEVFNWNLLRKAETGGEDQIIYGTSCRHIEAHDVSVKSNTLVTLKDIELHGKLLKCLIGIR